LQPKRLHFRRNPYQQNEWATPGNLLTKLCSFSPRNEVSLASPQDTTVALSLPSSLDSLKRFRDKNAILWKQESGEYSFKSLRKHNFKEKGINTEDKS
jgi:hypothetical protein